MPVAPAAAVSVSGLSITAYARLAVDAHNTPPSSRYEYFRQSWEGSIRAFSEAKNAHRGIYINSFVPTAAALQQRFGGAQRPFGRY